MKRYIIGFSILTGIALVIWVLVTSKHSANNSSTDTSAPVSDGGSYNIH